MKYKVYYSKSESVQNSPQIEIEASDQKSAAEVFRVKFPAKHARIITVDPIGLVGVFFGPSFLENPDFDPNAKPTDDINVSASNRLENQTAGVQRDTESTIKEILEVQKTQLYWIRIIGIPFLCSAVITAIYIILSIFK